MKFIKKNTKIIVTLIIFFGLYYPIHWYLCQNSGTTNCVFTRIEIKYQIAIALVTIAGVLILASMGEFQKKR